MKWFRKILLACFWIEGAFLVSLGFLYWDWVAGSTPDIGALLGLSIITGAIRSLALLCALLICALLISEYSDAKEHSQPMPKLLLFAGILFGIVPLLLGIGLYIKNDYDLKIAGKEEDDLYDRISKMQIIDINDELLLSPKGNPMGIKLTYMARFPFTYEYFISNFVEDTGPGLDTYSTLGSMQVYGPPTITPPAGGKGYFFDDTEAHKFVVNLIPYQYKYKIRESDGGEVWVGPNYRYHEYNNPPVDNDTARCFDLTPFSEAQLNEYVTKDPTSKPFWIEIHVTASVTSVVAGKVFTKHPYSMAMFHKGAKADGVSPCPPE